MVRTFVPSNLQELLEVINREDIYIFAGGTDLMVKKKSWSGVLPSFEKPVVFINRLNELRQINQRQDVLSIGACCTFGEIITNDIMPKYLKEVALNIASPAIRNIATVGGNICNASPAADILPPLYALGALVLLEGVDELRKLAIEDFVLGPGKTALRKNEILKEILIPHKNLTSYYYKKVGTRKSTALSKLSFFAFVNIVDEIIEDIGIAFGAVAPTVVVSRKLGNSLKGRPVEEVTNIMNYIKSEYSKVIHPIDDQRSSAEYRKNVALNLLEDFLIKL